LYTCTKAQKPLYVNENVSFIVRMDAILRAKGNFNEFNGLRGFRP